MEASSGQDWHRESRLRGRAVRRAHAMVRIWALSVLCVHSLGLSRQHLGWGDLTAAMTRGLRLFMLDAAPHVLLNAACAAKQGGLAWTWRATRQWLPPFKALRPPSGTPGWPCRPSCKSSRSKDSPESALLVDWYNSWFTVKLSGEGAVHAPLARRIAFDAASHHDASDHDARAARDTRLAGKTLQHSTAQRSTASHSVAQHSCASKVGITGIGA